MYCHKTKIWSSFFKLKQTSTLKAKRFCLFVLKAVRVAGAMQEEVTAKRGELDAMQNKLVIRNLISFNILLFLC